MVLKNTLPLSMTARGGSKYPPRNVGKSKSRPPLSSGRGLDAYDALKLELSNSSASTGVSGADAFGASRRTGRLSDDAKKLRMAALQERQNLVAQRKKQQAIVLQKFTSKYGVSSDRATKSALVNCVGKMVSLYFEGRALSEKLTATMLADLEEKVVAACAKIPAEVEAYKRDFELSGGSYAHSKPKNVPDLDLKKKDPSEMALPKNINNDWAALTIANAIDFEEGKKREKLNDKDKKMKQRQKFDKQKAELEERRRKEREEEIAERARNERKYQEYLKQEEDRKAREAKQHSDLRAMYNQQVEQRRVEKEKERLRLKLESEKDAARLARELKQSEDDALSLKRSEKKRYQAMIEESAKNELLRQETKSKEAALDQKLMSDYKAKLDREEKARADALKARMSRYEGIGKEWATTGAGAQKAAEEKKVMDIIAREAKKKEARDDERNRRDREKLLEDKVMMKKLNSRLAEEKRERERQEKKREIEYFNAMKKSNTDAIEAEKQKEVDRRNRAVEYKKKLVEQQSAQRTRALREETDLAVSETERRMNAKLFSKLRTDAELIEKIQSKFEPVKPTAMATDRGKSQREGGGVKDLMVQSGTERTRESPNKRRRNRVRR